MASWATAVAASLRRRGVEDLTAALTTEVAVAAFRVAFETWVGPGKKRDLPDLIRGSFDRLRERRWRQERVVGSQPGCQRVHVLELVWQRLFLPDLSPPFLMEMALSSGRLVRGGLSDACAWSLTDVALSGAAEPGSTVNPPMSPPPL